MSLLTFPCSRRKGVEEYQAILASLDGLQDQHLDWQAWAIIVFDVCVCVCFFFFGFLRSGVVYAASLLTRQWSDLQWYQV